MRVRHLLALGVVFGAFGAADLNRAQAQSQRMVQFLLLQENRAIFRADSLIARQNFAIRELNILYQAFPTRSHLRSISHYRTVAFNIENILVAGAPVIRSLDDRTLAAVQAFDPGGTTSFTNQAFNNDTVISNLLNRSPYGLTPATLM